MPSTDETAFAHLAGEARRLHGLHPTLEAGLVCGDVELAEPGGAWPYGGGGRLILWCSSTHIGGSMFHRVLLDRQLSRSGLEDAEAFADVAWRVAAATLVQGVDSVTRREIGGGLGGWLTALHLAAGSGRHRLLQSQKYLALPRAAAFRIPVTGDGGLPLAPGAPARGLLAKLAACDAGGAATPWWAQLQPPLFLASSYLLEQGGLREEPARLDPGAGQSRWRRRAAWFYDASGRHLNADRLRKAGKSRDLGQKKADGFLSYDTRAVAEQFPEYAALIEKSLEAEGVEGGLGRPRADGAGIPSQTGR